MLTDAASFNDTTTTTTTAATATTTATTTATATAPRVVSSACHDGQGPEQLEGVCQARGRGWIEPR